MGDQSDLARIPCARQGMEDQSDVEGAGTRGGKARQNESDWEAKDPGGMEDEQEAPPHS